jgi:putative SOS response-associated peptidase YedK
MCGRFIQKKSAKEYGVLFKARATGPGRAPSWNIPPGQPVMAVREKAPGEGPELWTPVWGLIPHWARERGSFHTINARIETVDTKPAYRDSFRRRRCLITSEGYYEWQERPAGKQPFFIHRPDGRTFALAGLWDAWTEPGGTGIETFTIIVRPARPDMLFIHDRMPALLSEERWGPWMDPALTTPSGIMEILTGPDTVPLVFDPVGRSVNNPQNDGEELVQPVSPRE